MLRKKIPDTSCLVGNTVLSTKIGEAENKNLDHSVYIDASDFIKSTGSIFNANLKEAKLQTNRYLSNVKQCHKE